MQMDGETQSVPEGDLIFEWESVVLNYVHIVGCWMTLPLCTVTTMESEYVLL